MPLSFSNPKRFLLIPRQHLAYGQDFRTGGLIEHCNLSLWYKNENGRYELSNNKPDLVVSQNPDDPADAQLLHELKDSAATVVIQHCRWNYFDKPTQANIRRSISSATLCVSPAAFLPAEMMRHLPISEWRTASNGVRPDRFMPARFDERMNFRLQNMIPVDHLLVGFVGRLEIAKGTQVLIRLAEMIGDRPISLFIQFPGWEKIREKKTWADYLEIAHQIKEANPRRVFLQPDLHPLTADRPVRFLDALVLPSLSEVQPLVILEAVASGVPVLSTTSSPFLPELRDSLDEVKSYIHLFDLPPRLKSGNASRTSTLTRDEVEDIATQVFDSIVALKSPSFADRELISQSIYELGYAEAAMNLKLSRIFDEALEIFSNTPRMLDQMNRYPLRPRFIAKAPEEVGLVEFYDSAGNNIGHAATSDQLMGIKALLLDKLRELRAEGTEEAYFRCEVCDDPQARLAELAEQRMLKRAKPA